MEDLLGTVVYYCIRGIGGEADVKNTKLVEESFHFDYGMGGTAVQAAMALAQLLFGRGDGAVNSSLWALYAGLGVTLGHNFPFYLKFRGGKGIACMAGILTFMDFRIMLTCLVVFGVTVGITRYVSLGSILVAVIFFAELVIFGSQGSYRVAEGCFPEFCVLGGILMVMAIWRHRANIKRLLTGTENKLGASKKPRPDSSKRQKKNRKEITLPKEVLL